MSVRSCRDAVRLEAADLNAKDPREIEKKMESGSPDLAYGVFVIQSKQNLRLDNVTVTNSLFLSQNILIAHNHGFFVD